MTTRLRLKPEVCLFSAVLAQRLKRIVNPSAARRRVDKPVVHVHMFESLFVCVCTYGSILNFFYYAAIVNCTYVDILLLLQLGLKSNL